MKITNVDKGKAYHLSSDTMLQVERPNLFLMNMVNRPIR